MSDLTPIDDVMRDSLKSYGEEFYMKYLRHSIFFNWKDIIGERNAAHIKPLKIEYKRLYVYAAESSWRASVQAYKSKYIEKINDYVGEKLIDNILFGSAGERPLEDIGSVSKSAPPVDMPKELKMINLTDTEIADIEKMCSQVEDEALRNTMLAASIIRAKREKYLRKIGWHECPICGVLCKPEEKICGDCRRLEYEKFQRLIIKIFREVPFATYADIKNEIANSMPNMLSECTALTVSSIHSRLVQETCRKINLNDETQKKFLVMLFKGVKPTDLTDKIIEKTLNELRYDLSLKGRF